MSMRTLIVSSSPTPPGVWGEIEAGLHPRIDYLELARQMKADYVDVNRFQANSAARWLENKLRMDVRQAILIAEMVRKKGYESVLMMSERVAIPIALLLPKSVKQVVVAHHLLLPHRLRMIKATQLHNKWSVIVASTQAEQCVLQDVLQPGLKRLEHVLFPTDTRFFQPGISLRRAKDADHVLSLGLSKRDYPTLIRALKKLPGIACHLRIGSSWMTGKGGIEHERLPGNVILKPFVPLSELRHCYENCRFVIIPLRKTTQWSAGCTSAVLAQALGKPVIISRTPGIPDYVLDGETGILVELGNPDAMADAIDYLWNQPGLTDAMGRRAQEWVNATFSLDDWVMRMARIIEGRQNGGFGGDALR